jgi:hypothetical protein
VGGARSGCAASIDPLAKIAAWLRPGGYFMATLSQWNEAPYTEDDFFGVEMFWANFALDEYHEMLGELGFDLLDSTIVGHGFEGDRPPEQHPLVFTRKSREPIANWKSRWLPDA